MSVNGHGEVVPSAGFTIPQKGAATSDVEQLAAVEVWSSSRFESAQVGRGLPAAVQALFHL